MVTRSDAFVTSSRPSWTWYFAPKYVGGVLSWVAASRNSLWSIQTRSVSRSEIASYSAFQAPVVPSVGDHAGKQSYVSSNVTFLMMMFFRRADEEPRRSSHAPLSVARRSSPTIVVLSPTRIRTLACWAFREATRAASRGPVGSVRPHTAGSYVARKASSV